MSLSKRIFTAFLAFIIVPLFVLGTVSYLFFQNITQEKYAEQTELTLKSIGRNIYNMIKEADYFSDFWVTTKDSVEAIEQSIDQESASSRTYAQLQEEEMLRQRVLLTYPGIQSVTLYRNDGRILDVNLGNETPIDEDALKSNPIYKQVERKNGAPVWIGPYEDPTLNGKNNLFTQIRVLLDVDTLKRRGVLVTRFQMNELSRIFSFYNGEDNADRRYLIVGRDNTIIFDNQSKAEGLDIASLVDFEKAGIDFENTQYRSTTLPFDGSKSLVSIQDLQLERLGVGEWKLVMVTSWSYLSGDMLIVLRWMVAITAITLLLALMFNLMFVRRIVTFIVRVVRAMRQVERGDLSTRVQVVGQDETSILARGFNSLVTRVSELLNDVKQEQHRKRKAEMMLLQAQIKPHFLFNALESINILAVQNEGRKVSKMVQRLANIFRISIQQKEEITIEQELEHLTSYLEIQKYRFEELFEYEIDVPEQLQGNPILKLTLQPLVENSIQHGFEGIDYMGSIRVRAQEEGRNIAIYVEDNGIGMSNERMALLTENAISSLDDRHEESPEKGERRGLGFGNVADRLRIHYGNSYGLILCSAPGQGTTIKCIIPKAVKGKMDDETKGVVGR